MKKSKKLLLKLSTLFLMTATGFLTLACNKNQPKPELKKVNLGSSFSAIEEFKAEDTYPEITALFSNSLVDNYLNSSTSNADAEKKIINIKTTYLLAKKIKESHNSLLSISSDSEIASSPLKKNIDSIIADYNAKFADNKLNIDAIVNNQHISDQSAFDFIFDSLSKLNKAIDDLKIELAKASKNTEDAFNSLKSQIFDQISLPINQKINEAFKNNLKGLFVRTLNSYADPNAENVLTSLQALANKYNDYLLIGKEFLTFKELYMMLFQGKDFNSFSLAIKNKYNDLKARFLDDEKIKDWNLDNIDEIRTKLDEYKSIFNLFNQESLNPNLDFSNFDSILNSFEDDIFINKILFDAKKTTLKTQDAINAYAQKLSTLKNKVHKVLNLYNEKNDALINEANKNDLKALLSTLFTSDNKLDFSLNNEPDTLISKLDQIKNNLSAFSPRHSERDPELTKKIDALSSLIDSLDSYLRNLGALKQTVLANINSLALADQATLDINNLKTKLQAITEKIKSLQAKKLDSDKQQKLDEILNNFYDLNKILYSNQTLSLFNDVLTQKQNALNQFEQTYIIAPHERDLAAFSTRVNQELTLKLNDNLERYGLTNKLTPLSFTDNNFDLYTSLIKPRGTEVTRTSYSVDIHEPQKLKVSYTVTALDNSSFSTTVKKELTFTKDVNALLNALSSVSIENLFTIDYEYLNTLSYEQANDYSLFNDYVSKNNDYINGYFKYQIHKDGFLVKDGTATKLKVDYLFNDNVLKTVDVPMPQLHFIANSDVAVRLDFNEEFKKTKYFTNPSEFGNGLGAYFGTQMEAMGLEKGKAVPNPTARRLNSSSSFQISDDDRDNFFKKIISNIANNVTDEQLVPYSDSLLIDVDTNENIIKFKINKDGTTKNAYLQVKNLGDAATATNREDEKRILRLLGYTEFKTVDEANKKYSDHVLEKVEVKNKLETHSQLVAWDAARVKSDLERLYTFPSFGQYQVYIKSVKNVDTKNGAVDLVLWYKHNGQEVEIPRGLTEDSMRKVHLKYFKPLMFEDINPRNNSVFSSQDFTGNGYQNIDSSDITKIQNINSTNFTYRRTKAYINSKNQKLGYALVDPEDIVQQKAYTKLNYLIGFKGQVARSEDENKDAENASKFDNLPDSKEATPKNTVVQNSTITISTDEIKHNGDLTNQTNLNELSNKYFIYFIDVRASKGKNNKNAKTMTFKLGFIDKNDVNKRYLLNKDITLDNLQNDYKNNLYPEVILNNITFENLNLVSLSQITAENLKSQIGQSLLQSQNIKYKETGKSNPQEIEYNNFTLNLSTIKIADVKIKDARQGKAYIRLKYQPANNGPAILGNRWYLIEGLKASNSAETASENNLTWKNNALHEIYSSSSVKRQREIEAYYKDLYWSYYEATNTASWTLKRKYIEKTLLDSTNTSAELDMSLFGNVLFQDDRRLLRFNEPYKFTFDVMALKQNPITKEFSTNSLEFVDRLKRTNAPAIKLILKAQLTDDGIVFSLKPEKIEYKIFISHPDEEIIKPLELNGPRGGEFKSDKAFLLRKAAAKVTIRYENNKQKEDFGFETNKFDYKKLSYTQENMPILFSNDYSKLWTDYSPNQNVSYKFHEGYLLSNEYLNFDQNNTPLFKNLRERTMAYNYGSATVIGKASNSKDNTKFFLLTNNHVEKYENIQALKEKSHQVAWRYLTRYGKYFSNNINAGHSYWGGLYTVGVYPKVVWTGKDQLNNQGLNPVRTDLTIIEVDIKDIIKQAKSDGRYETALWFENWKNIKDFNLNYVGDKVNDIDNIPYAYHGGNNGFPFAKQAGYIINRAKISSAGIRLDYQNGYVPAFFNQGNSGSGVFGEEGLNTVVNSGTPLKVLNSWNYASKGHNFMGINNQNEDPLSLKNTNSFASILYNLNIKDPHNYDIPWFLKK
ncbi:MGA_1079 family surface serine endopeptidase [Mycoplasma struthionis]|uniref:DUF31 domain-containing protein n=1 Tax=Mycoplasma struthionis TaxID=538220 RepID=A0A502M8G9_9MOLU|nr:hypothetical protein [Mycoplasma struthionis]TPI01183.1 hypothetical protein FJM01_03185 [Mycoplasma struthionis]